MSDNNTFKSENYPILDMCCEAILSLEIKGKHLELSGGEGGFDSVILSANELRMLSNELLEIAEILDKVK